MKVIKSLSLFLILFLPFPAVANEPAEILWEQAIAAKGGREQLHQVTNLVMSYRETVRNFLGFAVHQGVVERLPVRVAVFYQDSERAMLMFDFSYYVTVNGIQMPGRQKKGKINFQINAAYDENIFTRSPSVEAGPKAWQRSN